MIFVAVGSKNRTKIKATERAFRKAFGRVRVESVEIDSGISPQPMTAAEAVKGAMNRAKKAIKLLDADFGVGIEGGAVRLCGRWFTTGFVAIVNREGKISIGTSGWFECPGKVVKELKRGIELGEVMERLTGEKKIKEGKGAIGIFTKGHVDRTALYEHGVWMALCKFLSPEFFK
ncbi:MAG: inosine/xanthosine triphosphatase [Candidatus Hadarchaeales archaeon]